MTRPKGPPWWDAAAACEPCSMPSMEYGTWWGGYAAMLYGAIGVPKGAYGPGRGRPRRPRQPASSSRVASIRCDDEVGISVASPPTSTTPGRRLPPEVP
ncbi:hypothetical protein HPB52_015683 [Rhipicephalus sanguineus]|uniref:Uncharacterized protein n=1 Tax=Rhipicephalus sanguineus TaxID=34632 RepID=A0A9D4SSH3_RHISA|nr:hypothetical protein HPB52_015683 [Rhipicephalus sanguineus]